MIEHLQQFWEFLQNVDLNALLANYGYYAILILTFLEGETIVILAGIAASHGTLDPKLVALCAFVGSTTSDQIMFSLGKYKGAAVLKRFPRLNKNVDKAARLIKKYDVLLILGFRFVYGVRNVTPIMLGISGVSHPKFLVLNIIGAGVWAAAFTAGGYYAAKAFSEVMEHIGSAVFYIIGGVIVIAAIIWFFRRRHLKAEARRMAEIGRARNAAMMQEGREADTGSDSPARAVTKEKSEE